MATGPYLRIEPKNITVESLHALINGQAIYDCAFDGDDDAVIAWGACTMADLMKYFGPFLSQNLVQFDWEIIY